MKIIFQIELLKNKLAKIKLSYLSVKSVKTHLTEISKTMQCSIKTFLSAENESNYTTQFQKILAKHKNTQNCDIISINRHSAPFSNLNSPMFRKILILRNWKSFYKG